MKIHSLNSVSGFPLKKKKKSLDLAADYSRTLSFSNGRMNKTTINTVAAVGDFERLPL